MTAAESTPREAVAQALEPFVSDGAETEELIATAADAAATALLAGDWLERVLTEHRDWNQRDDGPDDDWFVCRCGVELETSRRDVEPEFVSHVAERIRFGGGGDPMTAHDHTERPTDLADLLAVVREVAAVMDESYPADGEQSDSAFLAWEQARLDRIDAALAKLTTPTEETR